MLRIGICDDDQRARFSLVYMLEQLTEDQPCDLFEFSSGTGCLKWMEKHPGELDLLFLDIEMPDFSGMETAKKIRKTDTDLIIVFATGYVDYVFDGYSVGALDYLTKPVEKAKLEHVLKRVFGILDLKAPDTFCFKNTEGMYRVNKRDILFLQSDRRMIAILTRQARYRFYGKLDDVQTELGAGFARIHQRYLVRCGAVDSFVGDFVMVGQQQLPVSRSHRAQTMALLAEDLLGGGDA